jgi:quercetin 2,3-dioxygenase
MLTVHKNSQRGAADHGWLQSNHSFSFGSYYNPNEMGFGPLRVINEDRVQPNKGFGEHGHDNMEIISYVLSGSLEHKDSMGNGSIIRYGDVQRMSAGTGVRHSEFNPSKNERVHFLQIWIQPNVQNIEPSYEEKHFNTESKKGALRLIASENGRDGSVVVHQDVSIFASIIDGEDTIKQAILPTRTAYLHLILGQITVNGQQVTTGDSLKITNKSELIINNATNAEFLLFDLPY